MYNVDLEVYKSPLHLQLEYNITIMLNFVTLSYMYYL